jgi:zinc transporter ZupT
MLEELSPFWFSFLSSLVAAFGTGLGGLAVFLPLGESTVVGHANAAASGVMMMLCFLSLVPEALRHLTTGVVGLLFVSGSICFLVLQERVLLLFVMSDDEGEPKKRAMAAAVITSVILCIHNAPEGLAVLLANSSGAGRGLSGKSRT